VALLAKVFYAAHVVQGIKKHHAIFLIVTVTKIFAECLNIGVSKFARAMFLFLHMLNVK
jgi:hypothetical protein